MNFTNINNLIVEEDAVNILKSVGLLGFEELMGFEGGELVKDKTIRTVVKIDLGDGNDSIYLKRFYGRQAKKNIFGTDNGEDGKREWFNTVLLNRMGIGTYEPLCFGEVRSNKKSFTEQALMVTRGLDGAIKLDRFFKDCDVKTKRKVINKLSDFARDFHRKGLNHQDFYLTHFLYDAELDKIFIVDLQRVYRRQTVPKRYLVKDLAQFVYSAQVAEGFTKTDLMRFLHGYFGVEKLGRKEKKMLKRVFFKAKRISRHTDKLIAKMHKSGAKNI